MSVDSDVAASLALASAPKPASLFDFVAPDWLASVLPSFANGKNLLIYLIANPGVFLTLSKAMPALTASGSTYSDRLENGLIPIERVVVAALDSHAIGEAPTVTVMSELTEEQLVEQLVATTLHANSVHAFGVQGNSGLAPG